MSPKVNYYLVLHNFALWKMLVNKKRYEYFYRDEPGDLSKHCIFLSIHYPENLGNKPNE